MTASTVKPYTFNKGLVFESSTYDYVYSDGTFGNEVKSNIVGVVIYNGNPKEKFNDLDLPDQYCNGLAISTKNVVTTWGGSSSFTVPSGVKTSPSNFGKGGYSAKKIITDAGKNLPIYTNSSYSDLSKCNTSGWYIGTNKEWDYILSVKNDINTLLEAASSTSQVVHLTVVRTTVRPFFGAAARANFTVVRTTTFRSISELV